MRKSRKELQAIVDRFNQRFKVGDSLELRKDDGWIATKVFAPATVLQGHSAVAWFDGVRGAYSIDGRVREVAEAS